MSSVAVDYGQYRGRRALWVVGVVLFAAVAAGVWKTRSAPPLVEAPVLTALPAPVAAKKAPAPKKEHGRKKPPATKFSQVLPMVAAAVAPEVVALPAQALPEAPLVAAPAPEPEPEPAPVVDAPPAETFDGNGEAIARLIARAKRSAVQDCYERELKRDPKLAGRVSVELELAAPQTVEGVKVNDDLGSPAFTQCVQATMQHVKFPALNEDISVTLPFVLTPRAK